MPLLELRDHSWCQARRCLLSTVWLASPSGARLQLRASSLLESRAHDRSCAHKYSRQLYLILSKEISCLIALLPLASLDAGELQDRAGYLASPHLVLRNLPSRLGPRYRMPSGKGTRQSRAIGIGYKLRSRVCRPDYRRRKQLSATSSEKEAYSTGVTGSLTLGRGSDAT